MLWIDMLWIILRYLIRYHTTDTMRIGLSDVLHVVLLPTGWRSWSDLNPFADAGRGALAAFYPITPCDLVPQYLPRSAVLRRDTPRRRNRESYLGTAMRVKHAGTLHTQMESSDSLGSFNGDWYEERNQL